jgi:hypothetical protein
MVGLFPDQQLLVLKAKIGAADVLVGDSVGVQTADGPGRRVRPRIAGKSGFAVSSAGGPAKGYFRSRPFYRYAEGEDSEFSLMISE